MSELQKLTLQRISEDISPTPSPANCHHRWEPVEREVKQHHVETPELVGNTHITHYEQVTCLLCVKCGAFKRLHWAKREPKFLECFEGESKEAQ